MKIFSASIPYCVPVSYILGSARSVQFDEPSAVILLARVCEGGRARPVTDSLTGHEAGNGGYMPRDFLRTVLTPPLLGEI
jgi:hypothetical protein